MKYLNFPIIQNDKHNWNILIYIKFHTYKKITHTYMNFNELLKVTRIQVHSLIHT